MKVNLSADQITALLNQLPAEAHGQDVGFVYDGATLTIPDAWATQAQAVMAQAGWEKFVPPQVVWTPRALIETLFTAAEQQAIFTAAQTNWQISKFISLVTATPQVNIQDPEFVGDINAVAQAGLLTSDRAAQILAGTPAPAPQPAPLPSS